MHVCDFNQLFFPSRFLYYMVMAILESFDGGAEELYPRHCLISFFLVFGNPFS